MNPKEEKDMKVTKQPRNDDCDKSLVELHT